MRLNKVKECRRARGLTQKELAKAIGVTHDYISQIERGRVPGMDTAQKLAEVFGTTIDYLFFDDSPNSKFGDQAPRRGGRR